MDKRFNSALTLLCALWLLSSSAQAQPPSTLSFYVASFTIQGELPIATDAASELLTPYGEQEYDLNGLQQVAKALEAKIRAEGFAFYRVVVPPQTLSGGEVTLQIVPFNLAKVAYKGLNHFDEDNINRALPALIEGESPNTELLARQLKVANRHPSRQLRLTFKQGQTAGDVDARVDADEQKPLQFSLILANTGSEETGDYRLTAMAQHSNLWGRDHVLNFSGTTSPSYKHDQDVAQYALSYTAPLYQQLAWLSGYLVYSDVNSGQVEIAGSSPFEIAGAGVLAGIHLQKNLPRLGRFEHWLDLGLDTKFFDNDVQVGGVSQVDDIRSTPLSLQYQGEYAWARTRLNFHLQHLINTGLGGYNSDSDYQGSGARPAAGTDVHWDAQRYGLTLDQGLFKGWNFRATLEGQASNEPLIGGEQFGIGGSTSVRGYQERETSADSGVSVRAELYTPPVLGRLTGVFFADYGKGKVENPQTGFDAPEWELASWGVGVRAQWQNVILSLDAARVSKSAPATLSEPTEAGDGRLHGTLIVQF